MLVKKIKIFFVLMATFMLFPLYALDNVDVNSQDDQVQSSAKSQVNYQEDEEDNEDKNEDDNVDKIVIFYLNDVNGIVLADDIDGRIGLAKISTFIKQERKKNKNVLFLSGGDSFFGSLLSNSSRGEMMIKIFNEMGLDGGAIGNRDFYYGYARLNELKSIAKFPFLMANIIEQNGNRSIFQKNYLISVGGYNVGVFGLSNPYLMQNATSVSLANLAFLDPTTVANAQVKILQKKGANIIIALTHLGLDASIPLEYRSVALSNVEGINIVIDGHIINPLTNGFRLGKTIINSAGQDTVYLGKLTIEIDGKNVSYNSVLLDSEAFVNVKEDKNIIKIINNYEKYKENSYPNFKLDLNIDLEAEITNVRTDTTLFSILLSNALKNYKLTVDNVESKLTKNILNIDEDKSPVQSNVAIDIAMINAGFIKRSIYAGTIGFEDIFNALPYENYGVVVKLKGWEIKEALEKSMSRLPNPWAGFLHVSGVTFDVDSKLPVGQRVSRIRLKGKDIDNNGLYNVLISDYLYKGKDEYLMFIDKPLVAKTPYISHIFMNYLKNIKLDGYEFISPIKFLN
jgi:5'-nucleotidase